MADLKISALPAASVALAGTEVLPIVQSSATKQVTVANLTAGRAVATGALTVTGDATLSTGNLVQGTAAKGINFTANTPAAGMTSQLLNWYEEGAWTPVGNGITYAGGTSGKYTRIGNLVTCTFTVVFPVTVDGSGAQIQGMPFNASVNTGVTFGYYTNGFNGIVASGNGFIQLFNTTATAFATNASLSGQQLIGFVTYQA